MTGDEPMHDTRSAKLAALRDYWLARRCGRRLPGRRDIDPVDLPRHLSTLLLIDGIGGRYRFRLVGTKLSRLMVRDPTGLHLDQVLEESELEVWDDLVGHLALHREALAVRGHLSWASGWAVPVEWMLLPLASDGTTVDMVVACAELPELPPRLPAGRPRFSFSWPPQVAPAGRWNGDGPSALKRWLNGVSGTGLAASAP